MDGEISDNDTARQAFHTDISVDTGQDNNSTYVNDVTMTWRYYG